MHSTDPHSDEVDASQDSPSGSLLPEIDFNEIEALGPKTKRLNWWGEFRRHFPGRSKQRGLQDHEDRRGAANDGLGKASRTGVRHPRRASGLALIAWLLLLLPLAGLGFKAVHFDRSTWPSLVGDEAVYLMAAQSIAWDRDFKYSQTDYNRFIEQLGQSPDGLILQSPDQGRTLFFGKAWLYPLAIAPFVKAMPSNGYAVANVLYLAVAALLSAWALRSALGAVSPVFVSVCVFASITFAHVFWAHPDLFLMCCVASGCSLLFKPWFDHKQAVRVSVNLPKNQEIARGLSPSTKQLRFLGSSLMVLAGSGLLVSTGLVRPSYLPLLLIPIVCATDLKRLVVATASVAALTFAVVEFNTNLTGVWSPYAGERQAFYGYTGFPEATEGSTAASIPHPSWKKTVEERGDTSWTGDGMFAFPFERHQFAWNILYVFIGRNTGLFPYFLPFLLGLFAFRADRVNWYLLASVGAIVGLFLIIRPFNYYGGGGALANRYFLPIYPLTWFLARRSLHWRWPAIIAGLAVLSLLPKWIEPASYWRKNSGAFSYVSEISERFLPHETTQSNLKPANLEDFEYTTPNGTSLWVKPLSPRINLADGGRSLTLKPGTTRAEILVASPVPIEQFRIDIAGQPMRTARFKRASARHRMWWSFEVLNLYRFDLEGGEDRVDRPRRVLVTPRARAERVSTDLSQAPVPGARNP